MQLRDAVLNYGFPAADLPKELARLDAEEAKAQAEDAVQLSKIEAAITEHQTPFPSFSGHGADAVQQYNVAHPTAQIVVAPNTGSAAMAVLPSEKTVLAECPNLTMEEINSLLPPEPVRANAAKGAAIAAAKATAEAEWCAAHPVEYAEKEAAEERAQANDRAEALAGANANDRQQARQLVDQMRTSLMMGSSRQQLKTDLFMASGKAGPETRQVIEQMQTNLFMGHSKEQLRTDLFMLNP